MGVVLESQGPEATAILAFLSSRRKEERLADCFGKPLGGVCLNNIGASFSLGWFSSVHVSNCGGSHVVMLWQEVVFLVVGQQLDAQHGGPRTPANIPSDFPTSMTQP